ncbi:hypothetical protein SUGI_0429340 [Cryptomeria japonica]|nr:hypothetical protein SUGI_0429340 [Cryptomeria japonica]
MVAKWLIRKPPGSKPGKKEEQRPKQVIPQSRESRPSDKGHVVSQQCYRKEDDVDKAAEIFIQRVHMDLKLQRSESEARYEGYLTRAT